MAEPRFSLLPVEAPITGGFGQVYHFPPAPSYLHRGIDFGCPEGTPVRAPAAGMVTSFTNDGSFGTAVCLLHSTWDTWRYTLYAHLSLAEVYLGQQVSAGQQLGLSGATGQVTAAHLHWQLCRNSFFPTDIASSADPMLYYHPEDEMPDPRVDKLVLAFGGEAALDAWNSQGNSLLLGYGLEQAEQNQIEARLAAIEARLESISSMLSGLTGIFP